MISKIINEIQNCNSILISTTSRTSQEIVRLPTKEINGELIPNYLITDELIASELLKNIDGKIKRILIDVERKQSINLMKIAKSVICYSQITPYKPNDITLEAADQLFLNRLGMDLTNKKVLVYGTGNIAFKIALRLLEREVDISLIGRNQAKAKKLVDTLNMVKPKYSQANAYLHRADTKDKYEGMISFISQEKIIDDEIVNYIKNHGFVIDGGIGNFKGEMIAKALEKSITVLRLDVRLGNPFLNASMISIDSENEFFNKIIGSTLINNNKLVAGGIIGEEGSIIVDRIKQPTQIIGIANGYGGVKNEKELTSIDRENLQYARETFLSRI